MSRHCAVDEVCSCRQGDSGLAVQSRRCGVSAAYLSPTSPACVVISHSVMRFFTPQARYNLEPLPRSMRPARTRIALSGECELPFRLAVGCTSLRLTVDRGVALLGV